MNKLEKAMATVKKAEALYENRDKIKKTAKIVLICICGLAVGMGLFFAVKKIMALIKKRKAEKAAARSAVEESDAAAEDAPEAEAEPEKPEYTDFTTTVAELEKRCGGVCEE